ncbi:hypothetical protein ACFPM0_34090 [Pseudonocardia sulfidoxydans]|uniref:hypothetical protein n=1 Tax=Pseudonocardia sulfidoxydans TaxID=54011 RepID=UPI00360AB6F0
MPASGIGSSRDAARRVDVGPAGRCDPGRPEVGNGNGRAGSEVDPARPSPGG